MSRLFTSSAINGMVLMNRFVRSATWEGMATEEGAVTPRLIDTMVALAKGGVGLIISSQAYVSPEGQAVPWQIGIYKDELMEGLEKMTAAVHAEGRKIVAQLAHAGHLAAASVSKMTPLVVSDFEELMRSPRKEISLSDIQDIKNAFSNAAIRAKETGFDGIQLHAAHGYLLTQFLSPAFNRRKDEYGGDINSRARMLLEVFRAVRKEVGKDYPVLMKLNSRDFIEDGLTLEDSVHAARLLADAGIDAIELSGGILTSRELPPSRRGINSSEQEAYFREEARTFKKQISVPLILVGGIRSLDTAERLAEEGIADYISMSRPLIREPNLIKRWQAGDRRNAACLSDNRCFKPGMEGKGICCITPEKK
jgi:2,4-dienoyl-CoA reductase-like NADH-dependent reductase (Old Yellow Enzyme family)